MAGNYQMIDGIGMPGGILEVGYDGPEVVFHVHGGRQVRLTAEGRERFQRAFMDAERRAEDDGAEDDERQQVPSDVRPREGEPGFYDVTCGGCGEEFGTNFVIEEIECAECEARRCPNCRTWFGAQS